MIISAQQFQAFEERAQKPFKEGLVECAQTFAPAFSSMSGEGGIQSFVQLSLKRALDLGFTGETHVELYVMTSLDLGLGFDADPQYPWATAVLHGVPPDTAFTMANGLYRMTQAFEEQVHGEENALTRAAFQRVLQLPKAAWTAPGTGDAILQKLEELHPQRFHFAGEDALRGMLGGVERHARLYASPEAGGQHFVRAAVAFLLGQAALFMPERSGLGPSGVPSTGPAASQTGCQLVDNFLLYATRLLQHPSARR